jgi:hypothetical protein
MKATVHKLGNRVRMYLQSITSVKHNASNSVNRSILKKSQHLGFGVFIVNSSMGLTFGEEPAWTLGREVHPHNEGNHQTHLEN